MGVLKQWQQGLENWKDVKDLSRRDFLRTLGWATLWAIISNIIPGFNFEAIASDQHNKNPLEGMSEKDIHEKLEEGDTKFIDMAIVAVFVDLVTSLWKINVPWKNKENHHVSYLNQLIQAIFKKVPWLKNIDVSKFWAHFPHENLLALIWLNMIRSGQWEKAHEEFHHMWVEISEAIVLLNLVWWYADGSVSTPTNREILDEIDENLWEDFNEEVCKEQYCKDKFEQIQGFLWDIMVYAPMEAPMRFFNLAQWNAVFTRKSLHEVNILVDKITQIFANKDLDIIINIVWIESPIIKILTDIGFNSSKEFNEEFQNKFAKAYKKELASWLISSTMDITNTHGLDVAPAFVWWLQSFWLKDTLALYPWLFIQSLLMAVSSSFFNSKRLWISLWDWSEMMKKSLKLMGIAFKQSFASFIFLETRKWSKWFPWAQNILQKGFDSGRTIAQLLGRVIKPSLNLFPHEIQGIITDFIDDIEDIEFEKWVNKKKAIEEFIESLEEVESWNFKWLTDSIALYRIFKEYKKGMADDEKLHNTIKLFLSKNENLSDNIRPQLLKLQELTTPWTRTDAFTPIDHISKLVDSSTAETTWVIMAQWNVVPALLNLLDKVEGKIKWFQSENVDKAMKEIGRKWDKSTFLKDLSYSLTFFIFSEFADNWVWMMSLAKKMSKAYIFDNLIPDLSEPWKEKEISDELKKKWSKLNVRWQFDTFMELLSKQKGRDLNEKELSSIEGEYLKLQNLSIVMNVNGGWETTIWNAPHFIALIEELKDMLDLEWMLKEQFNFKDSLKFSEHWVSRFGLSFVMGRQVLPWITKGVRDISWLEFKQAA